MAKDSKKKIEKPSEDTEKNQLASTRQHAQTKQRTVASNVGSSNAALKELAENYHTILENSLNGTVVVDASTAKILFANKAALKLHGFNSLEELGEANLLDYIHPDDRERTFVAFVKDFFDNTSHEQYEFRTISKDGSEKRVLSYSVPIQYQNKLCGVISFVDITERKKMEEALRASEEKLRAMFESMSEAATITDLQGHVIDANPAAVKLHRYNDKKEIIGINASELVADRDRKRAIKDSIAALKTNQTGLAEYKLTTKGGTLIDGEFCTAVIRDHSGDPTGFIGISRDISDRKRMEEKLRETERKLETIFNSITDGLIITDMIGTVIEANEAAVRIGKYKNVEALIGRSGIEFITESERKRVGKALLATITDPKKTHSEVIEYIAQDKDGKPFYGETSAAVIRDSSGKPTGMIFVTRDVSGRKRIEEKLRNSEEELRTFFDSIRDGIIITDLNAKVVDVNNAMIQIGRLGSKKDVIGNVVTKWVTEEDKERVQKELIKQLEERGYADVTEYKALCPNGTTYLAETSAVLRHNSDGKAEGIVFITRDITERKRLEDKIKRDEEKLSAVFEAITSGVCVSDMQGNVTEVNAAMIKLGGFSTRDELIGKNALEFVAPKDRDIAAQRIAKRVEAGRGTDTSEYKFIAKDGREFDGELSIGIVHDKDGKPISIVAIARDITKRKRTEELIRASEERYRLLAENISDVIFIVDLNFKFLYISPSVYQLRGYTAEEAMQIPIEKTVTPDSFKRISKTLMEQIELLKSGKRDPHASHTVELEEYRKDGSTIWVEMKLNGIYDNDGNLTSLLGVTRDITVRRRVNEIIQAKEQELRSIFESMSDCLVITDEQLRIVNVNDGASQMTGFTKEELLGRNAIEILDKNELDRAIKSLTNRMQKKITLEREDFKIRIKDGSLRYVNINISNLNDTSGKLIGFVGVIRDITERKKIEETIRTSEAKLKSIFDAMRDAIAIVDMNIKFVQWNQAALDITGFTAEEMPGKSGVDLVIPEDQPKLMDELEKQFKGTASERQIYRGQFPKGMKYLEMSVSGLKDSAGNLTGFVAVVRDVTERVKMEEEIRSGHKLLSAVFESLRDGIAIVDVNIKFVQWNQAILDIAGWGPEGMLGKPGIDIVVPEDRPRVMEELAKQFIGTASERQSYRVQVANGGIKHIELSVSALKDDAGNITGFVAAIRDVTKRIAMERELKKALDDLQRSNKELEQFAYVASHDLQEPLRMISSYTQLLSKRYKGKLDTDADEFIAYAVDGADRMQKMIQDLLAYSRVTTRGKAFEPVDLEKAFSDAIDNLQIAIADNKATITHDPLPKVIADESQMIRLFQNLIGNALKFHGAEPPVIHVDCKDEESDYAISIKDNGIGIDKQYFNRLFIIFQRLHTRDQYPGTGIGLAVCKRTAERHGGTIWVESEGAGKGSTFIFTIPKRDLTKKVEPEKALVENEQDNNHASKEDKK